MENKNIVMWNLFSTYKTINSALWTVAIICVLSWIARFGIMFYDLQQDYTEYSATVESVTTTINGTMATTVVEVNIPNFGIITMNADGTSLVEAAKGDRTPIYCKDNNFSLTKPQKAPADLTKLVKIVSILSLILWVMFFIADKALLIPFFRYGGIEAWAINNLYRRDE